MQKLLMLFVVMAGLVVLGASSFAAELRTGSIMHVTPNSIWFQDANQLARWQKLKKGGDAAALEAYEKKVLGSRDAWQFIYEMEVKIIKVERAKHRVNVEMKTEGRMEGTTWLLDPDAIEK